MAYISKKTTADGVKPIGSNLFGTCDTAESQPIKIVSMPDFDVLVEGVTIHVHFIYASGELAAAMKVGSANPAPISHGNIGAGKWGAGDVISFTLHNNRWMQNDYTSGGGDSEVVTYGLTKSGNTITLTGSDGTTDSVTDENTVYGLSFNNGRLSLVPNGDARYVDIPDKDTTYTISISGNDITLAPSDGDSQTITIPQNALQYVKDAPDISGDKTNNVVINDVAFNVADGGYATAEGLLTNANGLASHAEGRDTYAEGENSHAEGSGSYAEGAYSHAEGTVSNALGTASHAEGSSLAQGEYSHAEGASNALGDYSHSEGNNTIAYAEASHAGGEQSEAEGIGSFVHGFGLWTEEDYQTVFGKFNATDDNQAFIIGWGSSDIIQKNVFTVDKSGNVRALGLVNEVLIYDKTGKMHVQGTIGNGKDDVNGLLNQGQGEGTSRDITSWNIEGMDLSAFRSLKIIARRNNATYGTTCQFELPLEGDAVPTRNVYVSGAAVSAHCDRNRLNIINCAVSADKTKFCVTQTFSLYGTAATTISDMYVEKIYGCY